MTKKSLASVFIWFVVLFVLSTALMAMTVTHNQTGLKFDIPDNWDYGQEGDHFIAQSPDESVILLFFVGKAGDVDELMESVADELDGIIDSPEVNEEPGMEEINGLIQVYIEGSGEYDGDVVDFDMTMVFGGKKSMSIIALGDIDSNQDTIDFIYSSVRQ
jgi:hypothetical protein